MDICTSGCISLPYFVDIVLFAALFAIILGVVTRVGISKCVSISNNKFHKFTGWVRK